MPNLLQRQQRLIEIGRIRIGEKRVSAKSGKEYPAALSEFRLTSRNRLALELAAKTYGGEVRPWEDHPGEYELYTTSSAIKVLFSTEPRGDGDYVSLTQNFERWAGNTCTHRCDGLMCTVWRNKARVQEPCHCDHEAGPTCKLVSRLMVILPEVPTLGLWRVDTGSTVFDSEIQALLAVIQQMGLSGIVPLVMSIDTRIKRAAPGEENSKFPVLRLEIDAEPVSLPALIDSIRRQSLVLDAPAMPMALGEVPIAAALPAPSDPVAPDPSNPNPTEDELRRYVKGLGPETDEFFTWCDGEGLNWVSIAMSAWKHGISSAVTFWEGAEKFREVKQG